MNAWKPVLRLARRSLMGLGGLFITCVVLVFGLEQLKLSLHTSLAQEQAALQEQQAQLETKRADLTNVREHIQRYQGLRNQGLVGDPDRALWVEQLQTSHREARLPDGLSVQLQASKPLAGSKASTAEADPSQPMPLSHDLQFEIRNVVESEVFSLIRQYRDQAKGRFRVNLCKLSNPKDNGLVAQCVLRFVSIPLNPGVTPPAQTSATP